MIDCDDYDNQENPLTKQAISELQKCLTIYSGLIKCHSLNSVAPTMNINKIR